MITVMILRLILFLALVSLTGCYTTPRLWENSDPEEYIVVAWSETTEEKLKQSGAKYIVLKKNNGFLVEKNSWRKAGDYTARMLGTAVTLVIDTLTIVVIGTTYVAIGIATSPEAIVALGNGISR